MTTDGEDTKARPGSGSAPLRALGIFLRRFWRLAGPFWAAEDRWRYRLLVVALVLLTIGQVAIPISLNLWNARLFDVIEQHSFRRFYPLLITIVAIFVGNMAINTCHLWVKRQLQLGWRRWLTRQLQNRWMAMGHHYLLNRVPGASDRHDNPDSRIAEDIRVTTEYAIDLAHSLSYCLLLLTSFINILWALSSGIEFHLGQTLVEIPGFLVWVAFAYAALASTLALWIGQPLISATDLRQTAEANFRFGLVHARENAEAIALVHGESGERRRFTDLFRGIEGAWQRQTRGMVYLSLFSTGYTVVSAALPILLVAPRYMSGAATLGQTMQSAMAFQQLAGALSWPVDNMQKMAEWRASAERVLSLRDALDSLRADSSRPDAHAIVVEKSRDRASLALHDLTIAEADGTVVLPGLSAEILPGERVLIAGEHDTAVKLFKVIAGLWPWGSGTVSLPHNATLFFLPQRPYMPIGSLRGVLAYPATSDSFTEGAMRAALAEVGLGALGDRLTERNNWDQILGPAEQQQIGIARLLLHRPSWIAMQEATDALDPDLEIALMRLVVERFPDAALLTVGFHPELAALHHRTLILPTTGSEPIEVGDRRPGHEPPPPPARSASWSGRLLAPFRRNERRSLTGNRGGKHGDWRN
ncbi:MAG: hypothetical protein RLZZ501_1497 [Pseudomonadota bacterium]|jgi:putative ATP-binding cassette transporter